MPPPSSAGFALGGFVSVPSPGLPLTVIRVAFQAGSIDDPKGKEGVTALAAMLLAQGGTRDLTSAQLLEALFPMAASIDVAVDKELTVFSGTVHRDHAERYISLLVAALTTPRWDPKEFERLRADALLGIEKGLRTSNDEALGKAALDLVMWKEHPYSHYVGGTVQGLKGLAIDDCAGQAARVFTRDRMLIGIGGAVDDSVTRALRKGLEALPATGEAIKPLPAPEVAGARMLLVQKETAESAAISMGYPYSLKRSDPDFYPMMVAVSALGEHRQFNGRLMRELRIKRGLNYGDYAYIEHFSEESGTTFAQLDIARRQQDFTVWLRPVANDNALFAVRAALYQLERFHLKGMTQDELDSTRGFLEGYSLLWEQTPMRRLGYAMDEVLNGTPGFLDKFRKRLPTLKLEEVNRVIRDWIHPEEMRMALVTPEAVELKKEIVLNAPSPGHYVTEKSESEVVSEDARFSRLPLGISADQIEIKPASELFEK